VNTDGNIIDFVVFGILHGLATKWYLVPVVAAIWFAVYYAIFRFAITRFNLKTPGRDIDTAASVEKRSPVPSANPAITCRRFWRRSAAPTTLSRWITALPVCVCRYTI
jgi:PTS system maltose and glucose-specific IIC component